MCLLFKYKYVTFQCLSDCRFDLYSLDKTEKQDEEGIERAAANGEWSTVSKRKCITACTVADIVL